MKSDLKSDRAFSSVEILPLFFIIFSFLTTVPTGVAIAGDYYVATGGNDSQPGSESQPWETIQKAANTVLAGSTVYVRSGTYNEQVTVNVSGSSAANGIITFKNYFNETPVIDGTDLTVPDYDVGLFLIEDKSYIVIDGFELRNYTATGADNVPVGIRIQGESHHITLRNNTIHDIASDTDAHGIAVYGTGSSASTSINSIIIEDNELYDLSLGSSEALVINGNVDNFTIHKNTVHDVNNIAIDCIGFEDTAPDPYDQARNGTISENRVYNVTSYGNPAYGNEYSAGGIYIDGGRDITIERNIVSVSDIGIEIASEHASEATSGILVRSNVLYDNRMTGIALGGYDAQRGRTEGCIIINNSLYNNDTLKDGNGELLFQYDTRDNIIKNNIVYANDQGLFITNPFTENIDNVVDYNLYFSSVNSQDSEWQWGNNQPLYMGFTAYQNGTGNDGHSQYINPEYAGFSPFDYHLLPTSPAIDAGEALANVGLSDVDGQERVQGGKVDTGAVETASVEDKNIILSMIPAILAGGDKCLSRINGAAARGRYRLLTQVSNWFYHLGFEPSAQTITDITASTYDLVVMEPVFTDNENQDYDIETVIDRFHNATHPKLVIAYVDIGQAEDWRTYWQDGWGIGNPSWIVADDPDGWVGNYPVKYWHPDWKAIWLHPSTGYLKQFIDKGFDGIYLDWVEAYSDDNIINAARAESIDTTHEMITWVGELAFFGRNLNPNFIVIAQNAAELADNDEYLTIIDAIAQEQTWFDGASDNSPQGDCPLPATDEDIDTTAYEQSLVDLDINLNQTNDGCHDMYVDYPESTLHVSTEGYLNDLTLAHDKCEIIFTIDYALIQGNVNSVYSDSRNKGFIPFASERNLSIFIAPVP